MPTDDGLGAALPCRHGYCNLEVPGHSSTCPAFYLPAVRAHIDAARAEGQRDQAAAVEEVLSDPTSVTGVGFYGAAPVPVAAVRAALADPSGALAKVRADAWDIGYQRGIRDQEQDVQHGADNPYRDALDPEATDD